MDTVNFQVNKDDVIKEFSFEAENSVEELKEKIKEEYNILSYIDIDFQIEKPMRVLGKFNVEPGILPRTFDRYELNKFGIKGKITLTFHVVEDYNPRKGNITTLNLNKYSIGGNEERRDEIPGYNINSEEDFPKLG